MDKSKLWSGRFDGETSNLTEAFTASQHFDRRLAKYDVAGTMAQWAPTTTSRSWIASWARTTKSRVIMIWICVHPSRGDVVQA